MGHSSYSRTESILEVTTYSDIVTDSDNTVNATDVVVFTIKAKNISNLALSTLTISHPYRNKRIGFNP